MAITLDGSNLTTNGVINRGTAVTVTGNVDFSIPIGARRITVLFQNVSTSGSSNAVIVQLGVSGTPVTTGYVSAYSTLGSSTVATFSGATSGFYVNASLNAAAVFSGQIVITNINGNTWVGSASCARTDSAVQTISNGYVPLAGSLDRVRITTTGADTLDAGSINILYE
jgi:hypothetical protein